MNDVLKGIIDISPELIVDHVCELEKLGKSEEITKIFSTKMKDNPKTLSLYKFLIEFLEKIGKYEESLKIMTKVYSKIEEDHRNKGTSATSDTSIRGEEQQYKAKKANILYKIGRFQESLEIY